MTATVRRPAPLRAPQAAAGTALDRTATRAAGYAILAIAALSGVGNFVAVQPLADQGLTAEELTSAAGTLRMGIAALSIVVVLDLVVSISLRKAFRSTGDRLVGLVSGLRIAYAAGFAVAIAQLIPIARHLDGDLAGASTSARRAGVDAGVERFNDMWDVALLLFGLHLIVLAVAVCKAGMPRLLATLLAIAGGGYLLDSIANAVTGTSPEISAYTFIGEFTFALWLVASHRRGAPQHPPAVSPQPALA